MKRIFHTWDRWECFRCGFFDENPPDGLTHGTAVESYQSFLRDIPRFKSALRRVLSEWPISCEHNLTNENMNRIAWLGQAAACISMRLPSRYRSGYNLLFDNEKVAADGAALDALNEWLSARGEPALTMESSAPKMKVALY